MKRRDYLTAVTTGTVASTAGCFWEDGDSKARLGLVSVSNYYERPQRFVVHVEENGENVLTTEMELDAGGNYPTPRRLDCAWSSDPGEFTVEIHQLTDPKDTAEVSIPGERTKNADAYDCVSLNFQAGTREFEHVAPRVYTCAEMLDDVELCVDEQ